MEFLETYHLSGLALGLSTFLIIGLFHPLVIKSEYYFGVKCWWCYLVVGIVFCLLSVWVDGWFLATEFGVVAFSSFWSILEVFQQRQRVLKGWFPENPKRKADYDLSRQKEIRNRKK